MEVRLIKIDRNGSKHYEGMITCPRCGGSGLYIWAVVNGVAVPTIVDNGVCHKCGGLGKVHGKWIERTPEYQAKLDAKRQAKQAEYEAKRKAEREAEEAKRKAEEEAIKAQKAISQHVGQIGEKIEITATYSHSGMWEQPSFKGFGTDTMYIHVFKDADGNVLSWKTQKDIPVEKNSNVTIKGTVKEHTEYRDERQTVLTRCKVTTMGE